MLVCRSSGGSANRPLRRQSRSDPLDPFELERGRPRRPGPRPRLHRARADPARGGGGDAAPGRLPDDVVADVKREALARRPRPAASTRASTAARAGRGCSGRWSRSSTGAPRTRSTGTSRTATTSGSTPAPSTPSAGSSRCCAGEIRDAYAVTERDAGSDPSRIAATAMPTDGDGWLLNGEKWFVTSGDVASVYIVMANVIDGGEKLPTLFVVERRARPASTTIDDPALHPLLPRRPPDDHLHRRRGRPPTT